MEFVSTKEAAQMLGVSSTTVKRWVAFFQGWFQKDALGHYIYSPEDIERLRSIHEQLQQGKTMQAILNEDSPTVKTSPSFIPSQPSPVTEELLQRINQLELQLAKKADDIVSMQILQHRTELEEIRKTVQALAADVESIQRSMSRYSERTLASLRETPKAAKKKSFMSALFSLF
ncbi:MerR family transcriptional regulator [Paenibacillus sp. 32352]|uniref:MerR family transcriptional regulator n=1 Tax=Paenibacillus sp. 32352 TaxID=1969111 RepID=UPI0009ACE66B|nr:MerR family transcriptional regulator [Paenibacillus sp. 32352]